MFIVALLTIGKKWKQLNFILWSVGKEKVIDVYSGVLLSHKNVEIL